MTDNLFVTESELASVKEEKIWGKPYNGRYHLPALDDPTKQPSRGWMRTTNLVGAYADTRALSLWEQRMMARGIISSPHLYEMLSVLPVDCPDDTLDAVLAKAREHGKANVGAERGTARHEMWEEYQLTGREIGTAHMRVQLRAIVDALNAHLLFPVPELVERIIVCEELAVAGTFDSALNDAVTGALLVGDLKTKARPFFTLLEVRAQLAVYAHATAMFDVRTSSYVDPPPFNRERGIIIHVPAQDAVANIQELDLVKGWETAKRCRVIVDDRNEAKSVGALRAAVRPLPSVTLVEAYARRMAAVSTRAEGALLAEECRSRGAYGPEVRAVAREVATRLKNLDDVTCDPH